MTTSTRGGSRPVTRSDDGRRNNGGHSGTGPKPKKVPVRLGDVHYTHIRTQEGKQVGPTLMLEVTKVDRDCIEFTDQHTGYIYHLAR